jgi:hypothetical protein
MFSGDAPRCTATMSVIRDRGRSKAADLFAYFSDPYGFLRTIVLSLADIAGERRAAFRQRRSGAAHVARGGLYPLIRASITVVMRDLVTALLMADIVEGVPASYATFVGYDEVAHHSGIRQPDALAVLERHDRQLARLERAAAQAPRPYHLVVLSDHGQTQGAPFRQRYGQTLHEVVQRAFAQGEVYAPLAVDEAWGEQIMQTHPRLLSSLTAHPGIGFVMVRSRARGAVVIGAAGRRHLSDDSVEGEDPLAGFDPTAADHLRRHDRFPHCPDLLVNSMYDPDTDEVAPFEEFMGSHGGLGGPQSRPFAVVPAQWSEPSSPIVGVEAMHRQLRRWFGQPPEGTGAG